MPNYINQEIGGERMNFPYGGLSNLIPHDSTFVFMVDSPFSMRIEISSSDMLCVRYATAEDIDKQYSCECEWLGCYHNKETQKYYTSVCDERNSCIGCPSPHFDEVYICGFCIPEDYLKTDNSINTLILIETLQGLKIPVIDTKEIEYFKQFIKG